MNWLQMIRDHVANSFHIECDDLEVSPFDACLSADRVRVG
jgi:type I restriction enzyme R subunit